MISSEGSLNLSVQELTDKIKDILHTYPLYRDLKYSGTDHDQLPDTATLHCDACKKDLCFDRSSTEGTCLVSRRRGDGEVYQAASHRNDVLVTYNCRNCRTFKRVFLIHWAQHGTSNFAISKSGEFPAARAEISSILEKSLGPIDTKFLQMAQRCREFGFGIGALAYMRRVVEDKMNALLTLLKEEKKKDWSPQEEARFSEATSAWQFSRKLNYAAEILPSHLKPGGANPLGVLHDLASEGLHRKSEDECIESFDKCFAALRYVFEEVESHRAREREYKVAMNMLDQQ